MKVSEVLDLDFRGQVEKVLSLIKEKPRLARTLKHAVAWEENPKNVDGLGWSNWDVHAPRKDVDKLVFEEIAEVSYRSANFIHFRLMNREVVKQALKEFEELMERPTEGEAEEIPWDLFDEVAGYEDLKDVFMRALETRGVHFLLVGPPASSKTLFLRCLMRLPRSKYVLGSRMTKAGLTDYLFTYQPRYLLLDEIDKMSGPDYGALLSLCEDGYVSETIFGRTREIKLDTMVFACCNSLKKIPPEVLSRFQLVRFKEYTRSEFIHVVEHMLVRRGFDEDLAVHIAKQVWDILDCKDVREARRVANLAKTKEQVDELLKVMKKYR